MGLESPREEKKGKKKMKPKKILGREAVCLRHAISDFIFVTLNTLGGQSGNRPPRAHT